MSVVLDVQDVITFERPLTRINKQTIRVSNPHNRPVAFKVKTTAPKVYCVRPNSEIIPPLGSVEIQIMHQAFKEEPALNHVCKDKFLILSAFLTDRTEYMSINDLWAFIEANDKPSIHQHKLRCAYGEPVNNAAPVDTGAPINTEVPAVEPVTLAPVTQPSETTTTQSNEEDQEQIRQLRDELTKYKDEVKSLREKEPVVIEKVQVVKQSSNPFSIIILVALFVAAVAYFIKS